MSMGRIGRFVSLAVLFIYSQALAAPPPKIVNAADGIFAAFKTHPVVGIGEWHGLAQELDFYSTLVRDPRFASVVGNVVVETGDAAQQAVVDRYVNGENVPYVELRKVWADTVGFFPTVIALGSINFFGAIRTINQSLPPGKRIKIWLGDPPIDWSKINTKADWLPIQEQRDSFPEHAIEQEILAKGKKTLVIYGGAHLGVYPGGSWLPPDIRHPNLRALLDASHPGALYVISLYVGYADADCTTTIEEKHLKNVSVPSLIYPIRGTSLEPDLLKPGCTPYAKVADEPQEEFDDDTSNYVGLHSDALLYLGPRKSFLTSPNVTDSYFDFAYRAELSRRMLIRTGKGMDAPDPAKYNTATPIPYWK
jgi:hypothetical protein